MCSTYDTVMVVVPVIDPPLRRPVTVTVKVPFDRYTCCSLALASVAAPPSPKIQSYDVNVSELDAENPHSCAGEPTPPEMSLDVMVMVGADGAGVGAGEGAGAGTGVSVKFRTLVPLTN